MRRTASIRPVLSVHSYLSGQTSYVLRWHQGKFSWRSSSVAHISISFHCAARSDEVKLSANPQQITNATIEESPIGDCWQLPSHFFFFFLHTKTFFFVAINIDNFLFSVAWSHYYYILLFHTCRTWAFEKLGGAQTMPMLGHFCSNVCWVCALANLSRVQMACQDYCKTCVAVIVDRYHIVIYVKARSELQLRRCVTNMG